MSAETKTTLHLEIGHILFIDVIGYSKLLMQEQSELIEKLNDVVLRTEQVRAADASNQLIRLATGDGMALVFRNHPEAPAEAALEIATALKEHAEIQVRMGVHSGPVNEVTDVNQRANIAGAGVNMAQRVMDCGDAGHILLSKRAADDLAQYREWQPLLHDLGEVEVKHGVKLVVVNLYNENVGNPAAPAKIRRAEREQLLVRRKRQTSIAVLLLLASFAIGAGVWWSLARGKPRTRTEGASLIPAKSIAVLPFANLSDLKENAFFADGVQDEILTNLAKIADLKVISRSSVMQYAAGATRNLRQIAQELGVAHVLEGNVQRSGDQLRVNAQLIDARTDAHLWAQVYDRKVADLFAMQSEIAHAIADQLQAKLSPKESAAIDQPPTANLKAYALYLRAKDLGEKPEAKRDFAEDDKNAEAWLTEAVQLDPNFVLAFCELAGVYDSRYWSQVDDSPECRARGDAAIDSATRLAPEMGEVHLARGFHFYHGYRQYQWARAEFALAQKALPNEPRVYQTIGYLDRREEASANMEKACGLNPANIGTRLELADMLMAQRRFVEMRRAVSAIPMDGAWGDDVRQLFAWSDFYEKADVSGFRAITPEKRPDGSVPLINVKLALWERDADRAERALEGVKAEEFEAGRPRRYWDGAIARLRKDDVALQSAYRDARAEVAKTLQSKPEDPDLLSWLGVIDAIVGNRDEALREGRRATELLPLEQDSIRGMQYAINMIWIYGWSGDKDRALSELERLIKIPYGPYYGDLRCYPHYESLRGDPRFEAIVASIAPRK